MKDLTDAKTETEQTTQKPDAVKWTPEQQQVIDLRGRSLLVSAAAGSGKTAVLVERIISMITDSKHPMDVDQLLVVTFTNAAAAQMRERVLRAIGKRLEEDPENVHLQRQMVLIHNAYIMTIDSFCLRVIRDHFYQIDLEPGFRIADEGELKLMREDVCDEVLEAYYQNKDEDFLRFADSYSNAKSDERIREMILKLYEYAQSYPWPQEWLDGCAGQYQAESPDELEQKKWMQEFLLYLKMSTEGILKNYEQIYTYTLDADGPAAYEEAIRDDLLQLKQLVQCRHWEEWKACVENFSFQKLKALRKYEGSEEKKDAVKDARDSLKKQIAAMKKRYFSADLETQTQLMQQTGGMAAVLTALTKDFAKAFAKKKAKKNIVDFSDIEHNALRILVNEETKEATDTAAEYRRQFREIMIDEYQDSNYVQESLLSAVSKIPEGGENLFMVGDVKQSIYRFRMARPELFMEKYDTFSTSEGKRQRIDLHKNFRSRGEVLDLTNDIFYRIMGRSLGNIDYDADAALYQGASFNAYENPACTQAECILIDEDLNGDERIETEALVIAQRIQELISEGEIPGKQYKDIVILLRGLSGWEESFRKVFEQEGIPLIVDSGTGYFSAQEVQEMLAMLRIIDNPNQDIPLTAVLRSRIGGFSASELAEIKVRYPDMPFYEAVRKCAADTDEPHQKAARFWNLLEVFRERSAYTPIHTLLQQIYDQTGYRNYVSALPAGEQRRANLDMLLEKAIAYENTSYHGVYHFIRYINRLIRYQVDYGEAETVSEQENAVRLMTIHKSKGLEFPIVFVAGMGKEFNTSDYTSSMICHPEYGIGLKWMDQKKRTKADTPIRQALSVSAKKETLGEELRILYVALTRAEEKLILTGCNKQKNAIFRQMQDGEKLDFSTRMQAACYWDWVIPALKSYGNKYPITISSQQKRMKKEMQKQIGALEEREQLLGQLADIDPDLYEDLDARFSWEYPYEKNQMAKQKVSVSEIKHRAMEAYMEATEEKDAAELFAQEVPSPYLPRFVQETGENQGALRGTAMHRFLECLDFAQIPDDLPQGLMQAAAKALVERGRMTEEEIGLLSYHQLDEFFRTETAGRMIRSAREGKLTKEQPFVMSLPADRIWKETESKDPILVQGIIDVFWEEEGGIVLLDYKTDRVTSCNELRKRYQAQLLLYAEVLERIFEGKQIRDILIYSFRLNETIHISKDV